MNSCRGWMLLFHRRQKKTQPDYLKKSHSAHQLNDPCVWTSSFIIFILFCPSGVSKLCFVSFFFNILYCFFLLLTIYYYHLCVAGFLEQLVLVPFSLRSCHRLSPSLSTCHAFTSFELPSFIFVSFLLHLLLDLKCSIARIAVLRLNSTLSSYFKVMLMCSDLNELVIYIYFIEIVNLSQYIF